MMELDHFKAQWQTENQLHEQMNKKNMEQLQLILQGKTTSLVGKLKKQLEKIITSLLAGLLLFTILFFSISDGFTEAGAILGFIKGLFVFMTILIFYWIRYKSINHMELSNNLKTRLEQLIQKLQRNQKLEVAFFIVTYLAAIVLGRFTFGKGMEELLKTEVIFGFAIATSSLVVFLFFKLQRYKKQIDELQTYLNEYRETN